MVNSLLQIYRLLFLFTDILTFLSQRPTGYIRDNLLIFPTNHTESLQYIPPLLWKTDASVVFSYIQHKAGQVSNPLILYIKFMSAFRIGANQINPHFIVAVQGVSDCGFGFAFGTNSRSVHYNTMLHLAIPASQFLRQKYFLQK